MFQSHVYLEVRILLSEKKTVFFSGNNAPFSPDPHIMSKIVPLAHALSCTIPEKIQVERLKNPAAVPAGCNLSFMSLLCAENGVFPIEFHRRKKNIHIEEIRLEEDAGRLTHSGNNARMDYTYAGCPDLRIRTSDAFELGEEAEIFLDELRRLIQYLRITDQAPAENRIRCNAYVALAKYPEKPQYSVKLRNLNSFNFVRKAVNAELNRQDSVLSSGGIIESESRIWNERQNLTEYFKSRSLSDRRQFEPVEPPVWYLFPAEIVQAAGAGNGEHQCELPEVRRKRLCARYGISRLRAEFICDEKDRADFFEEAVALGADPMDAAHWMASEVMRLLKWHNKTIAASPLTPAAYAGIITLFHTKQIHSGIAKQLLQTVMETGADPDVLIRRHHWKQISSERELLPVVKSVIEENPGEAGKLRSGEMAPLEFLTGLVMKKTNGMAVPQTVKMLLKRELHISIVYVLSLGGAICGSHRSDGAVAADMSVLRNLLDGISGEIGQRDVRFQTVSVGSILSEEIEPADWASLIAEIAARIAAGTASGIVVAHGTDTLPYTAALLFWLFSDAGVPIVLTASSRVPDESGEARRNLQVAVETACAKTSGVYVAFGGKILSPLNLKFERPAEKDAFANWNLREPVFVSSGPIATQFSAPGELDPVVLKQVLRETADSLLLCRIYPGLNAERYIPLFEQGVSRVILELYETGTGSMRGGGYSLKPLLLRGRKAGCHFYCTSQQQSVIDFSEYTTSRRVWREGVVPMGCLTTESVVALCYAAGIASDTPEEFDQLLESYAALYT